MTKKLGLSPDISYMLGIYSCRARNSIGISLSTKSSDLLERFVRIAVNDLDVQPNKIMIEDAEGTFKAMIYNSKLKKHFDLSLKRRDEIFKHKNEYSANYAAALFDCRGGYNEHGLYIFMLSPADAMLLERLGFHTKVSQRSRTGIINIKEFMEFIGKYSLRAIAISQQSRA